VTVVKMTYRGYAGPAAAADTGCRKQTGRHPGGAATGEAHSSCPPEKRVKMQKPEVTAKELFTDENKKWVITINSTD